jgi:cell division protein FtsN
MSHDYAKKKKASSAKSSSKGLPPWFWLFTGIVSGLFIAFLIYLSTLKLNGHSPASSAKSNEQELTRHIKEQAERMREGKETLKKPTFEFYQRLPEMTVTTPKPVVKTGNLPTAKSYILQAGSFQSFQDADSLKAQLIMQGLDVQIQSVKDQQGKSWHRVQVGPYSTANSLSKAQDVLANNNISSILIELK